MKNNCSIAKSQQRTSAKPSMVLYDKVQLDMPINRNVKITKSHQQSLIYAAPNQKVTTLF